MKKIIEFQKFLSQVKSESKYITWPTLQELRQSMLAVLVVIFCSSLFILGIDYVIHTFIKFLLTI